MLTQLYIRDLAIVSQLELDFGSGMSALTGETGAGKSILIDALGLTLGERSDNGMIRAGADRTEVSAQFDLTGNPPALAWLQAQELDDGQHCLLRRVLVRDGRSKAYINGSPVTRQSLQQLGALLVEIHGQHAHQSLLKARHQRELLDAYAGNAQLCAEVAALHRDWRRTHDELTSLHEAAAERASRLDLLRFQAEELVELDLREGEWPELDREQRRLAHAGELQQTCASLLDWLYEGDASLQSRLSHARQTLAEVQKLDADLESAHGLLDGALIQVEEATTLLRHFADRVELDPGRLAEVEERLGRILDLARKYRVEAEQLPVRLNEIDGELRQLERADLTLGELEQDLERLRDEYSAAAERLRQRRVKAAKKLSQVISKDMQGLGMEGGRFSVEVHPLDMAQASASGLDQVMFQVSANPGQPLAPLAKVASGGELSRISLAIQVATSDFSNTPTLIFDEVDVGIGGGTAEIVGQRLRQLGGRRQVLCVTHLPQVAAQAHQHYRVSKQSDKRSTVTRIEALQAESRVEELARMLGGVDITPQTRAHAKEMIQRAAAH